MMTEFVKTNMPGFLKDKHSGTVINTNIEQLENYKHAVAKGKQLNALQKDYNSLHNEIAEIKRRLGI